MSGTEHAALSLMAATKKHDDLLEDILEMYKSWADYIKGFEKSYDRDIKLYNNTRFEKKYKGNADSFVPLTRSTIETIVSAICTGDLSIEYQPQDIYKYLVNSLLRGQSFTSEEEQNNYLIEEIKKATSGTAIADNDLEVLNSLIAYWWESGDWDLRFEDLVRSGVKIGNGALWLSWEVDRAVLKTIPWRDYIFDPNATDDESSKFQGRRYLTTVDALKDIKILDPIKREYVSRYKNLNKIEPAGRLKDGKTDKQLKEEILRGCTVMPEDENELVEVIEIMTTDSSYAVANRNIIIESGNNPFTAQAELLGIQDMTPFTPGITWSNYRDESLLIGTSETATFWKEQERLNDHTNQKADAFTHALLQGYRLDPAFKSQAKFMSVPGYVLLAPQGAWETRQQPQVPNGAFNEEASIKNNIREVTAIDQVVKGVNSSSDITATEAKLQVANAGQRIEMKIRSLERGPLKRLAKLLYNCVRLYITDPTLIPVQTNQGIQPKLLNPAAYTQDFVPKVSLKVFAKDARKQEQSEAIEMFKLLIQDPTNNLEAIKKIFLPKIIDIDKTELAQITTPSTPTTPAVEGMPPVDTPSEALPPEMMGVAQSVPQEVMA